MRRTSLIRSWTVAGFAALAAVVTLTAVSIDGSAGIGRRAPSDMIRVDASEFTPLYTTPGETASEKVDAFYLDRYPVTNAQFLEFVRQNADWRRSMIRPLFADEGYLSHWTDDLDFGPDSLADRPVVNVSWFAAMAYADWVGKRLPTTAEWEIAAGAGIDTPNGSDDAAFRSKILAWYSEPSPAVHPRVGSTYENYWGAYDMHGLVWEWVIDFNTALVTGESRNNTDLDKKLFCGSGSVGASSFDDYAAFIRFALRSGLEGDYTVPNLGFRLAADIAHPFTHPKKRP